MENSENKTKQTCLSPRASNWIQLAIAAAAVTSVPAVHFFAGFTDRGYLLGSAGTTLVGALAWAVIFGMVGFRITTRVRKTHDQAAKAAMIGMLVIFAANAPLYLMAAKMHKDVAVAEAYMAGFSAATRVGRMAEKHPEHARKIGNAIGAEIMYEAFKDTFPQQMIDDLAQKNEARWKELGLNPKDY